jgi:hypothetical protein
MEIRVVDKTGRALPSAHEVLEALGLGELWKVTYSVSPDEVAKAIAALLKFCDLYPTEEGSWRGYLGYNVTVHLKKDRDRWVVEVAVPFEYDEGTALLLKRMQSLTEDVERMKHAIKTLDGRIKELEMLLRKRGGEEEEEEVMDEEAAERLAEVMEKLSKILGERKR